MVILVSLFFTELHDLEQTPSIDGTFLVLISPLSDIDQIKKSADMVNTISTDISYSDIVYESGELASITIDVRSEECEMNSGKPYDQSSEITLNSDSPIVLVCLSKHSKNYCRVIGVMGCSLEEYEETREAIFGDMVPSTMITTWDGGLSALEEHLSKTKQ